MAITIIQEPSYPNVTYTSLMYAVSSSLIQNPQYQYVMDIVSGSETLTRVKQFPNPAGTGIFNVAKILNDYLEYPTDKFTITTDSDFGLSLQNFEIKFGEEYGTSITSSTTVYNGQGSAGNPSVSGSTAQVFPGTVDPNNTQQSYDWTDINSSKFLTEYTPTYPSDIELYKPVGRTDYAILGHYGGGTASIKLYTSGGSLITTLSIGSTSTFAYLPIGGQNLLDAGVSQNNLNSAAYMVVTVGSNNLYYKFDENCDYDRVNFVYINSYGTWDHYGVNLPKKKTTSIKRNEVTLPFQNWSSRTSPFSSTNRGIKVYNQTVEDKLTISTNWLDQNQASWLGYLIESPEVYIQNGSIFNPVIITNASYTHNTNTRSQKAFQYEVSWKLANPRPNR